MTWATEQSTDWMEWQFLFFWYNSSHDWKNKKSLAFFYLAKNPHLNIWSDNFVNKSILALFPQLFIPQITTHTDCLVFQTPLKPGLFFCKMLKITVILESKDFKDWGWGKKAKTLIVWENCMHSILFRSRIIEERANSG